MVLRAIALSLALLIGIGVFVPLATEYAEAGPKKAKRLKKKREWRGVKKYSKRWWQLYHAQEKRKRSLSSRKRELRLRQLRLEKEHESEKAAAADTCDEGYCTEGSPGKADSAYGSTRSGRLAAGPFIARGTAVQGR